ncbi:hypothetical protein NECID01_0202 [Nematocida sp. AWRm77]|nr:hypothetical protein NECID01_0202 [Nematocida sp. AWRm77]
MESVAQLLESASEAREEIKKIKALTEKIEKTKEELGELARKEQEIKSMPDRVAPYRRRLEKIQKEIEKQEAVESSIASVESISSIEKYLTKKELMAKVSAYVSTLYGEREQRFAVDGVRVKARSVAVDLEYNKLVELSREKFPEEAEGFVRPVVEMVVSLLTSTAHVLAVSTPTSLVLFSYAQNRKTEVPEEKVCAEVVKGGKGKEGGVGNVGDVVEGSVGVEEGVVVEGDVEEGSVGVCFEKEPVHAVLSKLIIHKEVLEGVKRAVLSTLAQTSLHRVSQYNAQIFYGTVYYIDNTDTWVCDNLVTQMQEASTKCGFTPLSKPSSFTSLSAMYSASLKDQPIKAVSEELLLLLRNIKAVSCTQRGSSKKVRERVHGILAAHLRRECSGSGHGVSSSTWLEESALRLCDAKAITCLVNTSTTSNGTIGTIGTNNPTVGTVGTSNGTVGTSNPTVDTNNIPIPTPPFPFPSEKKLEEGESSKGEVPSTAGWESFFATDETVFLDILEEAFSGVMQASKCMQTDLLDRNAVENVESVSFVFTSTVSRLFSSSLRSHITAEFFNSLFSRLYETLCSEDLFLKGVEFWMDLCSFLLEAAKPEAYMILHYQDISAIYAMLDLKEKGSLFLKAYSDGLFPLSEEVILHFVPALFSNEAYSSMVSSHIEKQHKNE